MVIGPDFSREARSEDEEEIDALLAAAFNRPDEAKLVRRLRVDGDLWFEMVKPWAGVIAGYAAFSRLRAPEGWACLAPLAVLPRFQNSAAAPVESERGHYNVGKRLAHEIISIAKSAEFFRTSGIDTPSTIVVHGDPQLYEPAGFSSTRAKNLISQLPVNNTLITSLGDDVPSAELIYPPSFEVCSDMNHSTPF